MPSKAEWVLIFGFLATCVVALPAYVVITTQEAGWLAFIGFVFVALTKFITTSETEF